ncbi:hypothetical protein A9501_02395 [Haemophilus sp. CCUG 66565]|uniref:YadA-like family protein n=1 Tax=Haemophilus sp. CCUG 66565 TaxID=1859694 RepID=UPI000802E6FA|nr:YadA-like family protein [Haemophilus sp. CCUG 66565]OBX86816.1 hypothetical protein A9501_02395 [Haemophilus sp. CCUG 66565]
MAEHVMARTFINQTEVSDKIADSTKQIAILQGSSRPATSSNGTILISNGPLVRDGSIKIGFDIRDSSTGNAGDTIIGNYVKTGGGEKDSLSTAVGYGTQVAGPSVSIGVGSSSDIGDASGWNAVQNSGVAIGAFSRVSGQTTTTNGGVAIGAVAFADQGLGGSVAVGQLSGAATLMYDREVTADGILVPVNETGVANSKNLTSIGYKAGARSSGGVAIGENATTSSLGANAIAMGTASAAIKSGSIAIGHEAIAGGYSNKDDIAKLTKQKEDLEKLEASQQKRFKQKTTDMDKNPTAENKYQVASAKAALERIQLAIERINADMKRLSTDDSITTNAIAIGHQSKATHQSALAMGDNAQASGKNSLAQGNRANATAESAMAQGDSSTASGIYAVAQGRKANATANFTIAQGNTAVASAVSAIASGNQAKATAESAVAQGDNALSSGIYAIAQGRKANATANFTIAQGNSAVASAVSAIASGNQAKATADSAVAQGNNANAAADSAVAQGNSAKATGAYAIAQGRKAEATANFTIAQGNSANASAQYAMALGNQAKANIEHGVALGSSSETTVAKGVTGFNPTAQGTSDIRANAYAPLNGNALTSTLAGVSVGSATNTRQINHVAAGTADDDAVNVAQLRSVNLKIAGNTNGETESAKSGDMRNTATSKADVLLDSQTLNVVSSNTNLLTTDATNNTITITPKTTKVEVNNDTTKDDSGKATTPTKNGLVTATDLADTLNSMYWKATSAATTDGVVSGTEVQPVKAGNTVTFEADKNIKITQDKGKFTFATKDDVEFNTVTVGPKFVDEQGNLVTKVGDKYLDKGGKEVPADKVKPFAPVAMKAEKATRADNNQNGKAPTTALNVTSTDGKPTQITGVGSVLSNESVPTNTNGTPNNQPNLVNLGTKPNDKGEVKPLDQNVLNSAATVRDLANMGWIVGAPENGYVDTVKNANKVDFKAGAGISVTGKTNDKGVREITISVAEGNVKSNLPSVNDADKNAKDVAGNPIAGKDNKSAPITATEAADLLNPKTADGKANPKFAGNNAATVSDVLNTGWNLQNNGEARDFVKPYDTVNFVDGKGTKAVVESDHKTSNVTFNVDTVDMTSTQNGTVENPMGNNAKKLLDDLAAAKKAVADNPDDEEARAKLKDAEDAVNKAGGNKIATAQNVANMINNSGFTLKADKVDGGENTTDGNNANGDKLTEKGELIKPGSTVTMKAGKNMAVKHDTNGNITYATASNVTFNSVQFGDNGPKITNNGENINVGTATGAPTKITGVAPGEISATSKDAVNGSQLYSVAKGVGNRINNLQGQINKLGNRMNAGMATSAAMANLLQPHKPGQSVATAGIGQHKNQSAVAVGYSRISDNGKYGVRFSMGANTQGEVTGGAAVGYFW